MVEGIVLAAGSSSRAGCFKMELPLGNKTLIERSIEGMYDACARIIVVGGYRVERVREILCRYSRVDIIENVNWRSGMFSSVKVGVECVRADRFFLLPADVPLVPPRVYDLLSEVAGTVVIPTFRGRKGHPVLVHASVRADIMNEPDTSNLRAVIARRGYVTKEVDDDRILLDIDTESDYNRARATATV